MEKKVPHNTFLATKGHILIRNRLRNLFGLPGTDNKEHIEQHGQCQRESKK